MDAAESSGLAAFRAAVSESLHVLASRRFGVFWSANFLSNVGTWAQMVAQPWLLLSLGSSSFLLGLDAFALSGPVLLLTLFGGVLADRADRRRVIVLFQSIQMLCPTLIVLLLGWGTVRPWEVICLSLVIGVTDALSMPAFQTIVPSIVEASEVPAATALNSAQFNLCRILGPALAGLIMAWTGALGAFAVSAASYLPVIFIALTLLPSGAAIARGTVPTDYRRLFSGVRETMQDATLRGAVLTVFSSSALCGPLMTFCPVLIRDAFRGDVASFGIAVSAFGVGGVLGAAGLLGVRASRDRRKLTSFAGVLYGLVLVAAAVDQWFWVLPAVLALGGIAMTLCDTSANTLILARATARARGEAVSLYMLSMRGGLAAGSLVTGLVVARLGVREALLINGLLAIAVQGYLARAWFADGSGRSQIKSGSPP